MKLKHNRIIKNYIKQISEINEASSNVKSKSIENCLMHEKKEDFFNQEIKLLQKELKKLSTDFNKLKEILEKEVNLLCFFRKYFVYTIYLQKKDKERKDYEKQQILKNEKNIYNARKLSMEKLYLELKNKDLKIQNMNNMSDRDSKSKGFSEEKSNQENKNLKKQLNQERSFKVEAFQRVSSLQSQVETLEQKLTDVITLIRPKTAAEIKSKNLFNL